MTHTATPSINLDSLNGWQDFELMPPAYRARRAAEQTFYCWLTVLMVLSSIATGSSIALWNQGRKVERRNTALVKRSIPIEQMRQANQRRETENAAIQRWCAQVESAKPDDSMLQVLGALALSTRTDSTQPGSIEFDSSQAATKNIVIDSIEIKLPLEFDRPTDQRPPWATPRLLISASVADPNLVLPWTRRLESSSWIEQVGLESPVGSGQQALIQVTGVPRSSKVIP